jgi:hypothetical protein
MPETQLPTREQYMTVLHLAGEPCECEAWVKLMKGEVGDDKRCKPCRARKALEAVKKVAEAE